MITGVIKNSKSALLGLTLTKLENGMVKKVDHPPIGSKNVFATDDSRYYYKLGDKYLYEVTL